MVSKVQISLYVKENKRKKKKIQVKGFGISGMLQMVSERALKHLGLFGLKMILHISFQN